MANEEQVKILKQGIEVWNQWREEHLEERIDLSSAPLTRANLNKANLEEANLERAALNMAMLQNANLKGARMREINLVGANLRGANLEGANLMNAYLQAAKLQGAILRYVELDDSDLREADMSYADLARATLREVKLNQTNLSNANITGACLYGTSRDNWDIDGIQCEYIYTDFYRGERIPKDRNFRPGEFEKLYKQFSSLNFIFQPDIKVLVEENQLPEAIKAARKLTGDEHETTILARRFTEVEDQQRKQLITDEEATVRKNKIAESLLLLVKKYVDGRVAPTDQPQVVINTGDTYINQGGQVGAMGKNAQASGNTFQQQIKSDDHK